MTPALRGDEQKALREVNGNQPRVAAWVAHFV
jgi:hypothetical protein